MTATSLPLSPPGFLQLAGHPLRWNLLQMLARSDRAVQELTALIGEPQNLVSYHLGKLREARLVSARRSSADRRDTYYTLNLAWFGSLLSGAGAALHPGLRLVPPPHAKGRVRPVKVLFLCSGNSARSQMAEAMIRSLSGGAVEAYSAGSQPKPLHANAVRAMREAYGLDIAAQKSKAFGAVDGKRFDWVISLCDRVREVCPDFPGHPEAVHWSMPNPATGEADDVTYPLFQQTAGELKTRIEFLLAALSKGETHG